MRTDVTNILNEASTGDPAATEKILPLVYAELRRLAAARRAQEKPGLTLQPTSLLHEAYLRLVGVNEPPQWENRGHFFAAAAEAMRRIVIDEARKRLAAKEVEVRSVRRFRSSRLRNRRHPRIYWRSISRLKT